MPFYLDWFGWALGARARYSHFPTDSVSTYRFKTLLSNGFFSSLHITPDEQENRKPGVFLLEKKKSGRGSKGNAGCGKAAGGIKPPVQQDQHESPPHLARLQWVVWSWTTSHGLLKALKATPARLQLGSRVGCLQAKLLPCHCWLKNLSDVVGWHFTSRRGKEKAACVSWRHPSWRDRFLFPWNTNFVQQHPPATEVSISSEDEVESSSVELLLVLFWDVRPVFSHLGPRKRHSILDTASHLELSLTWALGF